MGGGPPSFPQGSSCPVVLRILPSPQTFRVRGSYPLWPWLSIHSSAKSSGPSGSPLPRTGEQKTDTLSALCSPVRFGLFRVRSPLLTESLLFSFPAGTKMFQFPASRSCMAMCSPCGTRAFTPGGFPHSDIHGSTAICASPWLFAACHVLRRLLVPRHPPYALYSLI